jgi:hypothetical protein
MTNTVTESVEYPFILTEIASTGDITWTSGDGAPTASAIKGSLYSRTDGSSASTRLYINNGTTTWVAVTTAS